MAAAAALLTVSRGASRPSSPRRAGSLLIGRFFLNESRNGEREQHTRAMVPDCIGGASRLLCGAAHTGRTRAKKGRALVSSEFCGQGAPRIASRQQACGTFRATRLFAREPLRHVPQHEKADCRYWVVRAYGYARMRACQGSRHASGRRKLKESARQSPVPRAFPFPPQRCRRRGRGGGGRGRRAPTVA